MINNRDKLIKICLKNMQAKNLYDETYKDRFKKELQEIDNQEEHEYFLELYNNKNKFNNENNLLITYLLGLCDDFDIGTEPAYSQGEFPDIDVDYLPIVQDYLRNEFCPKRFGRENVVNIGNYGTFGLKSALLDMARVHGADRMEIQTITKNLQDKDEEGKPVTWNKALELSPELNDYAKKYPEITDSAKRLIDRNRSRGKHAGGTVVSSVKIDDFVPIMIDTDGNPVSGWTEGLHDQDLQPVGLIKFDVLAIKDLLRIANCCKLIKQRHPEVKSISAYPDCSDWSDTAYLNDSKALKLGNEAKTRGVFQFDSEGMRNLVKSGGVDCFEDLVAYTALFRPSALKMQMHERYTQRKKGRETWEDQVPDCVRDILKNTYGVFCYQEQVMQVLNIVGDIPLIHCEKIRKAISKKKEKEFLKYKQMFLENGSKKTGWSIYSEDNKNINFLWNQLEAFSGYGFNKSVDEHTYIPTPKGLNKIRDFQKGDRVYCIDESGNKVETEVVNLHDHGVLECYSIVFDDGYEITCTLNHKFLTQQGQIPLYEILKNNISVFCEKKQGDNYDKKEGSLDREMRRASPDQKIKKCSSNSLLEMSEEHASISETGSLVSKKIIRAVPLGKRHCYDLEVACSTHNFILPNGIVTSNSHACAYTYISSRLLYLKAHYPLEFFVVTLSLEGDEDKLKAYKREAERQSIIINPCDINKSKSNFEIIDEQIYIGFSNIKGIGKEVAEEIVNKQPYNGIKDFLIRYGTDKRVVEPLIYLEVFKENSINILLEFYEDFKKLDKSNISKGKAQEKRRLTLMSDMKALLKDESEMPEHLALIDLYENFDDFDKLILSEEFTKDDFYQVLKKYWKSVKSYEQKAELIDQNPILLKDFTSSNSVNLVPNQFDLEKKYYGFSWQHPLEKSPDYSGDLSFLRFKEDEYVHSAGVECMIIKKIEEKISKKGKKYYNVVVEDEDWNAEVVTFWEDDYNRFREELEHWNEEEKRGNLIKIRLTKPENGFRTYTFEAPPRQMRHKLPEKERDYRLYTMTPPKNRNE